MFSFGLRAIYSQVTHSKCIFYEPNNTFYYANTAVQSCAEIVQDLSSHVIMHCISTYDSPSHMVSMRTRFLRVGVMHVFECVRPPAHPA